MSASSWPSCWCWRSSCSVLQHACSCWCSQESRLSMGIYSFLNRSAKKDERITELEAQVARLTDQNMKLAEPDLETEQMLAAGKATITALSERLEMAHAIEVNQAEVIATQKKTITDLQKDVSAGIERIRELEHDAAEYDVADDSFVQQIKDLQGECLAIASENSDLIMFVRKCATGAN